MTQTQLTTAEKYKKKIQDFLDSVVPVVQDSSLEPAIITDLDGTLFHMNGREFSEWSEVGTDIANPIIKGIVNLEAQNGTYIFATSGRDDECATPTAFSLHENDIHYDELLMRDHRDPRPDIMVKYDLFMKHIFGKKFVKYVLDDRQQVVDLWRKLGIVCLQVAPSPD
jgi:hypothetical protein